MLPPSIPSVAVIGGGRLPVRRIFCVGRNYADHAREMGSDPDREPPFFFSKPADAIVVDGADMPYPSLMSSLHFEIELVVAVAKGGADIPAARASEHVLGYAVGLDMTRRDLQAEAKKTGHPRDMAKAFDHSAPIGAIRRADEIGHPTSGAVILRVDGVTRQRGDLSELIWSVPEIVAHLSRAVRLEPGDLIFTGTPAGVGAVGVGARLEGAVEGVGEVTVTISS